MDRAWIRKQLITYYGYIDHGPEPEYMNPSKDVLRLEPTIREILRRLDPELADHDIDAYGNWAETLDAVDHGLGILAAQQACVTTLAADIPVLSAGQFHPWVWRAARTLRDPARYRHAVQAAATAINDHTQNKLDRRDIADTHLMQEAFSPSIHPSMASPGCAAQETPQARQSAAASAAPSSTQPAAPGKYETPQPTTKASGISRRRLNTSPP